MDNTNAESKTPTERQKDTLSRELLALLHGDPEHIRRAASGAHTHIWQRALRLSLGRLDTVEALVSSRDLSDPGAKMAALECAIEALLTRSGSEKAIPLLAPALPSWEEAPRRWELLNAAIKNSFTEEPYFSLLIAGAPSASLSRALFTVARNGASTDDVEWARILIQAGADPAFMKSSPMASAIECGNFELADFLAPLSDPGVIARALSRIPFGQNPVERSRLEQIQLKLETPEAPARPSPRL